MFYFQIYIFERFKEEVNVGERWLRNCFGLHGVKLPLQYGDFCASIFFMWHSYMTSNEVYIKLQRLLFKRQIDFHSENMNVFIMAYTHIFSGPTFILKSCELNVWVDVQDCKKTDSRKKPQETSNGSNKTLFDEPCMLLDDNVFWMLLVINSCYAVI